MQRPGVISIYPSVSLQGDSALQDPELGSRRPGRGGEREMLLISSCKYAL